MSKQSFKTRELIRLQVEAPGPVGYTRNLLPNANAEQGAYGWLTPTPGGVIATSARQTITFTNDTTGIEQWFTSESFAVNPGDAISARWTVTQMTTGSSYTQRFEFLDATGVVSATAPSAYRVPSPTAQEALLFAVPAGAVSARIRFDLFSGSSHGVPVGSSRLVLSAVPGASPKMVARSSVAVPDWSKVYEPWAFGGYDLLSPATEITVTRESLDVGDLAATVRDISLDPAIVDKLRPGKAVRLEVILADGSGDPFFTGALATVDATYDPRRTDAKQVTIALTAVDNAAVLASVPRPKGVATLAGLCDVLEGCRVPWLINGDRRQIVTQVGVAFNDQASALDQVAITRDSTSSYAFVDRHGALVAFDAAHSPANAGTIDESDYSDIQVGLSPCINQVTVVWLRYNPDTGETEEITYGPYVDQSSVDEWGPYPKSFTVQGTDESLFDIPGFAARVLAANGQRTVRATEVTIPLRADVDVAEFARYDLYDRRTIVNAAKGIDQECYLTRIEHQITPTRWAVVLGTDDPDQVASPTVTPSPSSGGGGMTLGQLLRPVGEVTMWYGTKAQIPAGWLACDGSPFTATDYPDLATLLGGTTLPNLTDRIPIGAGTKALGTSGGAATKTIGVINLPAHTHGVVRSSTTGTNGASAVRGGTSDVGDGTTEPIGGATPLDVMPPWRALWFIIRAR